MGRFDGLYAIRDGKEADYKFILATYLRGLYFGDSWFSRIPKDLFMKHWHPIATTLVSSPTTVIKVACLPEDPDTILGYSVLSADYTTVHWCHVKNVWRRKGIATALLPKHPIFVSNINDLGLKLLPKLDKAVFNPFAGA